MKALSNLTPLALVALSWIASPAAGRVIHDDKRPGHMSKKTKLLSVANSKLQNTLDKQRVRSYVTDDSIHHLSHVNPETPLGLQKRRVEHEVKHVDVQKVNMRRPNVKTVKSMFEDVEEDMETIKDILSDEEGPLEGLIEEAVEKKLFGPLLDAFPQMRDKMHDKCMKPSDDHVYFYVVDPRVAPGAGILAAIHPAWKRQYPVRLRKAVEQAGYHVVNATVVDAWTSAPHMFEWSTKTFANHEDLETQKPCSWHEVDSVSASGIPRGSIWYWTQGTHINKTLGLGLLEIDPEEFEEADRRGLKSTYITFKRIPGEDIFEIRKILLRTFPVEEVTGIAVGGIIGGLVGLTLFFIGAFILRRLGVDCCLSRKSKRAAKINNREKTVDGIELRDRVAAPEYGESGLESTRAPEPWRAL